MGSCGLGGFVRTERERAAEGIDVVRAAAHGVPEFVQEGGYPISAGGESPDVDADEAVDEARGLEVEP